MKALVLFDGAGLAARGLRAAGFTTVGVELDPVAHYLARLMLAHEGNEGSSLRLKDVTDCSLRWMRRFDVIWASPPCQIHSSARTQGAAKGPYATDLLQWSLDLAAKLPKKVVWIENVTRQKRSANNWGHVWNAHQFGTAQNRNRVIGGRYPQPVVERPYKRAFEGICPCITATEYKGCKTDTRRASRFYKRKLTPQECAFHMDLDADVVNTWLMHPMTAKAFERATGLRLTEGRWRYAVYRAIGNGVPIKMARAFGTAVTRCVTPRQQALPLEKGRQLPLFT